MKQAAVWIVAAYLLPLSLIVGSFIAVPYLSALSFPRGEVPGPATRLAHLYRYERCRFAFTAHDLLILNTEVPTADRIASIVFDVYPGTAAATLNSRLTWVSQIAKAIHESGDPQLAREFTKLVSTRRFATGEVFEVRVPADSAFRRHIGVQSLVAVAVRSSEEAPVTESQFADAIHRSIGESRVSGVQAVGLPFMSPPQPTNERSDRSVAWKNLLRIAHQSSCADDGGRIVLGGYALLAANRETNARAFQNAWREWKLELLSQNAPTAHDRLRVAAVMLLTTLIVEQRRGRALTLKRYLALVALSGAIGGAVISTIGQWVTPWLGGTAHTQVLMILQLLVAVAIGVSLNFWIRFDPRKQLKGGRT